jgi:hypothetical protein
MSDQLEVKAETQHVPYRCPQCSRWADEIELTVLGSLAVLFHGGPNGCKKILSCQLLSLPQMPKPLIQPAGGLLRQ